MWLPTLLFALMASGSACPDFCQCRSQAIKCDGQTPTSTSNFTENFVNLVISNVDQDEALKFLARISNSSSSSFTRIEELSLTNCSLTSPVDLSWFSSLRSLNLSYNAFTLLNAARLDKIANPKMMQTFDASYNLVSRLGANEFSSIPQLIFLDVQGNAINSIHEDTFKDLDRLETLNLADNLLLTLDDKTLIPVVNLQSLNLSGNRLRTLRANWFETLFYLRELDVSRNGLVRVASGALLILPGLAVLRLAENPLREIDVSLFLGAGRRLETVDASRTGLVRVPAALTRSIRELRLARNRLTSIRGGDFDSYPLLRLLNIADNRLATVEDDALGRLEILEELNLSGNFLPTIPKSLPNSLRVIDLQRNAIAKLKLTDLQGLTNLRELNLKDNVISDIAVGFFSQLPALELLDISTNPIKKLPANTLSGPTNLATLKMSGLISLELEDTNDRENQDMRFPVPTPESLVTLDVSRSPVLAAQLLGDNAALSACKSLLELDLSYANIHAIRSDLAYVLPQLKKLELIGNSWNCSEDQYWLGEWLRQHKDPSGNHSPRCAIPDKAKGKFLQGMPNPLNPPTTITKPTEILITQADILDNVSQESNASLGLSSDTNTTSSVYSTMITGPQNTEIVIETSSSSSSSSTSSSTNVNDLERWMEITLPTHDLEDSVSNITQYPLVNKNDETLFEILETREKVLKVPGKSAVEYENNSAASTGDMIQALEYTTSNLNAENDKDKGNQDHRDNPRVNALIGKNLTVTRVNEVFKVATKQHNLETTMANGAPTTPWSSINLSNLFSAEILEVPKPHPFILKNKAETSISKVSSKIKEQSANRVVSQFSRSKLFLSSEHSRVSDVSQTIAEELSSRATESGARISESLSAGAHPGMLVLLGAALGAAAALTAVLSRRATIKRRDQRYHRHENIEVHALTPTADLW